MSTVLRASAPDPDRKPLSPDTSCAEVIHPHLVSQLALVRRLDPLVRADVPDAVHQMRVACRRFRSVFGTYRDLFDPAATEPIRSDLKWLVAELGRPRDLEVLRMRVGTLLDTDVDLHSEAGTKTWVDARLAAAHRDAHRQAVDAMLAPRYVALLDALHSTVEDPPWSARAAAPCSELAGALRKDWRRLRKAVRAADRAADPTDRAARLHDVRKVARRARYAAEAVEPVFGRDAARYAKTLSLLQTILGEHHDDVVTRQQIRHLAATAPDGSGAFPVAGLAARLDETSRAHEGDYRTALSRAMGSRRLRWMERRVP